MKYVLFIFCKLCVIEWRCMVALPTLSLFSTSLILSIPPELAADPGDAYVQETSRHAKAAEFILEDQYNQTHHYRFPQASLSILLFADYTGSAQLEDWIQPIYARYQDTIGIYGVAELSIVPGFLQGLVRSLFRERLQYPVMLDWQGTVSRRYAYQSGQANLFVIDTQGYIVLKIIGAVDTGKLQHVFTQINALLGLPERPQD